MSKQTIHVPAKVERNMASVVLRKKQLNVPFVTVPRRDVSGSTRLWRVVFGIAPKTRLTNVPELKMV